MQITVICLIRSSHAPQFSNVLQGARHLDSVSDNLVIFWLNCRH